MDDSDWWSQRSSNQKQPEFFPQAIDDMVQPGWDAHKNYHNPDPETEHSKQHFHEVSPIYDHRGAILQGNICVLLSFGLAEEARLTDVPMMFNTKSEPAPRCISSSRSFQMNGIAEHSPNSPLPFPMAVHRTLIHEDTVSWGCGR